MRFECISLLLCLVNNRTIVLSNTQHYSNVNRNINIYEKQNRVLHSSSLCFVCSLCLGKHFIYNRDFVIQ